MRGSWMNRRRAGGKFNGGQGVSLLVGKPPECINHSRRAVLVLLSHFPSLLRNRLLPSTYTYETSELSSNSTWTVKSRPRVELIPRVRSINGGGSRSSIVKFHPFRVTWGVDVPLDTRVIYIYIGNNRVSRTSSCLVNIEILYRCNTFDFSFDRFGWWRTGKGVYSPFNILMHSVRFG